MSEPEPIREEARGSSLLNARTLTIIIIVFALLLVLGEAWRRKMVEASERKEAVENCHWIIVSLRLFSSDNSGCYPSGIEVEHTVTSNDVFRELFKLGACKDELIFGCPRSPFHPDGNVGAAPLFKEALQGGENHWAMAQNLTDSSPGDLPLVFENPADESMPLRWNTDAAGRAKRGRCWSDRTVLVGFNNDTVRWIPLEPGSGWRELKEKVFPPEIYPGQPMRIFQVDE